MTQSSEYQFILTCLQKIEQNIAWGNSEGWSGYDFEKLSDAIFEKTTVRLSTTTLKRVWGKIKYDNAPTTATLNTLAQFAGYSDWRNFKQNNAAKEEIVPPDKVDVPAQNTDDKAPAKKPTIHAMSIGIIAALLVFSGYFISKKAFLKKVDANQFSFTANKIIGEGVPNSVVFTYNAMAAKTDSVFIVQTWDIRRKTLVSKNGTAHSAIYYYPGFFRTKLIADGQVVQTHDLQITSDGWLGLIEDGEKPYYFNKSDILKNNEIIIDGELLVKNNFTTKPEIPRVRFFNQGDFGNLMNDNFTLETEVRNESRDGKNACQNIQVLIQCKDDIIIIPLAAKACIGEMFLYTAGKSLESKTTSLAGFGADLHQWTSLKVVCKNKQISFFVNSKMAATFTFPHNPTGIVGLQYRFDGPGAIRNTWFKNAKEEKVLLKE